MAHFMTDSEVMNPQTIRITISSKPNLWHLNRSLTIRHFYTTSGVFHLVLIPEIRLFSCFSTVVNSFPFGFFLGMHFQPHPACVR